MEESNLDAYTPEQLVELLKHQTPTELLGKQRKSRITREIKESGKDPKHGLVTTKKLPPQPIPKLILPM
jgi:hypothetical protein